MPARPRHPCHHPGCGTLTKTTYCEIHQRTKHQERQRQRGSTTKRGYGWDWQKLRRRKIMADPLCQDCLDQGRTALAEEVDHVIPFERRPELRLVWDNLRSLCGACHRAKTQAGS